MFIRRCAVPWLLLAGLICAPLQVFGQSASLDKPATEKALRAAFKKGLKSKDASVRIEAVLAYSEGTRELEEEGGAEKLVARTLAEALDDDDMGVCNAAMTALSWGREVATVIDACDESLEFLRAIMERTSTRPDDESRALYRGALEVYRTTCATLGNYPDDRSVAVLETELRVLRPGGQLETVSQTLVRPAVTALLTLGSQEAVELVIKQTTVYSASTLGGTSPGERLLAGLARTLHDALSAFAINVERAPPSFGQNYQQDWHDWFKKHKKLFADDLGKLKVPPGPMDTEAMAAMNSGGRNKPRRP